MAEKRGEPHGSNLGELHDSGDDDVR